MKIYTIGHARHACKKLVQLLKSQNIDVLVDVRSVRGIFTQHFFQKAAIKSLLKSHKIKYLAIGEHFESLSNDIPIDELLQSSEIIESVDLQMGISRLEAGVKKKYRLCLMGIEENPYLCRQFRFIVPQMHNKGIEVVHIRGNGIIQRSFNQGAAVLHNVIPADAATIVENENSGAIKNFMIDALNHWKRKKQNFSLQLID